MMFVHDTYMLMRVRYASALIVPVCTEYLTSNCFFLSIPKGRRAEMPQQCIGHLRPFGTEKPMPGATLSASKLENLGNR